MKTYQIKGVKKIFVSGGCKDLKYFFNQLKKCIFVKPEDMDSVHPMEAEMINRRRNQERLHIPRPLNMNRMREELTAAIGARENAFKDSDSFGHFENDIYNNYKDSIIFIAGDNRIGFKSDSFYTDLLTKCNKIMEYNNIYVIFIRGDYDNPDYFDGEKINFSHIKAVPDYSIVEVKNKNILCIGGAVSVDRKWKIEQEKRINSIDGNASKKLYWENEATSLDKDKLDEIFKSYDKIDYVISHSSPSFTEPSEFEATGEWCNLDESLKEDIKKERITLDRIFEYLRDNERTPIYWAYGHYGVNILNKRSNTIFRSMPNEFMPFEIENDIKTDSAGKAPYKKKISLKKDWAKELNNPFGHIVQEPQRMVVYDLADRGDEIERIEDVGRNFENADGDAQEPQGVNDGDLTAGGVNAFDFNYDFEIGGR